MIKRSIGICIVLLGILLVAGAVGLTVWNVRTDEAAGETNERINETVIEEILKNRMIVEDGEDGTADFTPGIYMPPEIAEEFSPEEHVPDTVVVEGREYIGVLSIPVLGLELSVMTECDDRTVDTAPGRWVGTPYRNGFVIGGHNYRRHLGKIDRLREGDLITFTDLRGNVFNYSVVGQEILTANQGNELRDKEWGLSLFTCTLAGNKRIVVRALLKDSTIIKPPSDMTRS